MGKMKFERHVKEAITNNYFSEIERKIKLKFFNTHNWGAFITRQIKYMINSST